MFSIRKTPLALYTAMITAGASSAFAEEDSSSLSMLLLEEVVVTAQKREENIQDVPVAVTSLDARLMQAQGINEPRDLKNIIPNFSVGDYQGEIKINIRGVGQLVQASNPGVAVHIDGVYQPRASMAGLAQVDMAGVEVLRGPQGTTYGRNANGGAVNYSTTAAGDELGGYILASYAEYDELRIQGAVDLPVSDAVRTRLTLDRWERGEGFLENAGSGKDGLQGDTMLARFRVDADLSDAVSGTLTFTHAEVDGNFNVFDSIDEIVPSPSPANAALLGVTDFTNSLGALEFAQDNDANQERQYQAVAATLNWDINDTFAFKSITAFQTWEDLRNSDNDTTNATIVNSVTEEEGETFTQEFNLTFSNEWVSGVVGLFYLNDELEGEQLLSFDSTSVIGAAPPIPAGSIVPAQWKPYEQDSAAVFADMSFSLSDALSLIAGVRLAQEEVNFNQAGGFLLNVGPMFPGNVDGLAPAGPPGTPFNECATAYLEGGSFAQPSLDYDIVTPRLGLAFAASDNNNLYATYSEGFKSGGYALRTGCPQPYDEETVNSFEVGSKNVLADGRVRLNATAFYYDYEGYQIEQLVGFGFELTNADAAEVMGLELESTFVLSDNLSVIANASYQTSEFTDYTASDARNPQLGAQDTSGNPLPGAPDATANISVIYEIDNGLAFQLSAAYKSEINFREFDNSADAQDAYTLWNANIRWSSEDDSINARLFANNITDEEYIQALFTSSLTANRIGTWGAPRQIGAEVRYNF